MRWAGVDALERVREFEAEDSEARARVRELVDDLADILDRTQARTATAPPPAVAGAEAAASSAAAGGRPAFGALPASDGLRPTRLLHALARVARAVAEWESALSIGDPQVRERAPCRGRPSYAGASARRRRLARSGALGR